MSRIDQNSVNLGPAKIKNEDSIYDSVDQGVVGATTTSTTTVVTPPVLSPITEYPINDNQVNFDSGFGSLKPSFGEHTPWYLGNLSSYSSFSNGLVVNAFSNDVTNLVFINMSNPLEIRNFPGQGQPDNYHTYRIVDGVLTYGWQIFPVGFGFWTNKGDREVTYNGVTQTVLGADIHANLAIGRSNATHRYFYLGYGWDLGYVYARIPHVGTFDFEIVAYIPDNPDWPAGFNSGLAKVSAISDSYLWISIGNLRGALVNVITGAFRYFNNEVIFSDPFADPPIIYKENDQLPESVIGHFSSGNGSVSGLIPATSSPDGSIRHTLFTIRPDGVITKYEEEFVVVPAGSILRPVTSDTKANSALYEIVNTVNINYSFSLYKINNTESQLYLGTEGYSRQRLYIPDDGRSVVRFNNSTSLYEYPYSL
jgi:hypothetical protein